MQKDFYEIQQKITIFLDSLEKSKDFTKTFWKLSTNDALFCAWDIVRNKAFFEAIQKAINDINKNDLVVVDAGSWTWILWFFAIYLWASKCIFIEKNEYSLEISKNLAKHLWFYEKCIFYSDDAITINIKENYDLIISETIVTAFLEEDFPLIIKNLKKENTKIIPEKFIFYFEWFDENWNFVEKNEIEIISNNIKEKQKIHISKKTKNIEISSKVNLYSNIFVNSWDCISFANKRKISINEKSKFLNFCIN